MRIGHRDTETQRAKNRDFTTEGTEFTEKKGTGRELTGKCERIW